jgi:hypothetical protein
MNKKKALKRQKKGHKKIMKLAKKYGFKIGTGPSLPPSVSMFALLGAMGALKDVLEKQQSEGEKPKPH